MDDERFDRQWPWCQGQVETLAVAARWTVVEAVAVTARGKAKWVLRCNKCRVLGLGGEVAKVSFRVLFKVSFGGFGFQKCQ